MATLKPEKGVLWDMSKRWTPALIADGFTPIPAAFLAHYAELGISSHEAMLIIHLMSFKWDEKRPFPRFARIAERMKISETATRGHARSLEKKGLLRRIKRPGRSNEFDLTPLFRRLEEAQANELLRQELLGLK
jgi:DNA-binding MarR family transcriptional regulator